MSSCLVCRIIGRQWEERGRAAAFISSASSAELHPPRRNHPAQQQPRHFHTNWNQRFGTAKFEYRPSHMICHVSEGPVGGRWAESGRADGSAAKIDFRMAGRWHCTHPTAVMFATTLQLMITTAEHCADATHFEWSQMCVRR